MRHCDVNRQVPKYPGERRFDGRRDEVVVLSQAVGKC